MDDLTAVKKSQAGNKAAFGFLIDRYYKSIYRYAFQCIGNHQDADDICQETFLRALDRIQQLKDGGRFKGWIFMIASNLYRKRVKDKKYKTTTADVSIEQLQDTGFQPLENLSVKEKAMLIQKQLRKMPEQIRMTIVLVLIEGLTQKETAEILDCSESTISRNLDSGRECLRNSLRDLI
jgi:RNA polymerase sigma-70 factor (ECF subfamily)